MEAAMRQAFRTKLMLAAALVVVVQSHNFGQRSDAPAKQTAAKSTYVAPRASGGHPDLQGVWTNNAGTPLERPAVVADKTLLTDEELAAVRKQAALISDECGDAVFGDSVFTAALGNTTRIKSSCGETGNYNQFWL